MLEGEATIGPVAAVLTVAVPVLVFGLSLFAIYTYLMQEFDPFHILLYAGMVACAAPLRRAGADGAWSIGVCLIVAMLGPVVVVVGYETIGHRHQEAALERMSG